MPRTPVPAAGEAMPAAILNRRAILTGTAATAAALAASTLPAEPATVAARINAHIHALMTIVGKEAPGAFDMYSVKGGDGQVEGFAFVSNEAGNGVLETLHSRFRRKQQPDAAIIEHRAAQAAVDAFAGADDVPDEIFNPLCARLYAAFVGLLAYHPQTIDEARAKIKAIHTSSTYGAGDSWGGELDSREADLLLRSFLAEGERLGEYRS